MSDLAVHQWGCEHVSQWLVSNGFSHYTELLCTQHRLDGPALLTLNENDLKHAPLQINVLGDIKRLMISLRKLQFENRNLIRDLPMRDGSPVLRHRASYSRLDSDGSTYSEETDMTHDYVDADGRIGRRSQRLEPEYLKLIISYVYMFSVFLLTSVVMVVVHDRVPDMKRYPPLPDIVLDNMPYVPWAFEMCELTGMALGFIWAFILIFHKHRFILMRRMFSMAGTVFLLRCVTMLITSLSVPGTHLQCRPKEGGDLFSKLERALIIWRGFGMTIQGVRTCGDYMFSGHTVMVTLFNFFITEYTPRRIYWLHTTTWIMNIFGIFFILAAHEHYSIDVFIAFYITSRMFLYYHSLANNRALVQMDSKRTRIWFPLFSFFESKVNGIVPNEYEWPLPWPAFMKASFQTKKKKR